MNSQAKSDIEEGLDHYDPEGRVFPKIAAKVAAGQRLTKRDILQILRWKLGHVKKSNPLTISDENLATINRAIKDACKVGHSLDVLESLEKIPGIGLPTATAILSVCYPDEFVIIDFHMLELFPFRLDALSAKKYLAEYLPKLKAQRDLWGCTLRDTDRALCGLSIRDRLAEIENSSG